MGKTAVKSTKYKPLRGELCANCGEKYEPVRLDMGRVRKVSVDPNLTTENLAQVMSVLEDKEKSFTPGPRQVKEGYPTFWRQFPDMNSPTKYVVLRTKDITGALVPTHILFETTPAVTAHDDTPSWPKGLCFAEEDMKRSANGDVYLEEPTAYLRMEWDHLWLVLSIEGKYAAMQQIQPRKERKRKSNELGREDQTRLTGPPSSLTPKRPPSSVQTRSESKEKVSDVVAVACEEHSGSQ